MLKFTVHASHEIDYSPEVEPFGDLNIRIVKPSAVEKTIIIITHLIDMHFGGGGGGGGLVNARPFLCDDK